MATTEYIAAIQVTAAELAQMNKAQLIMLESIENRSTSGLESKLNGISLTAGVIGLFAPGIYATISGLVSATAGVISTYPSYNSLLVTVMQNGCNSMGKIVSDLLAFSKYDLFELEFPFIDFKDKGIRYVQGDGRIVRAHVKGGTGWVSMQ